MARPSKIDRFIEEAEKVLKNKIISTDNELRLIVNDLLGDKGVCRRTIQRWKSLGLLKGIGIYPSDKVFKKTGIKFHNQSQYQKEYYYKVGRFKRSATSLLCYHLKKNGISRTKKTFEYFGPPDRDWETR